MTKKLIALALFSFCEKCFNEGIRLYGMKNVEYIAEFST